MAQIVTTNLDSDALLATLAAAHKDAGGIASFVGHVRSKNGDVTALVLDHYRGFTEIVLQEIEDTAKARFGLLATLVVHRIGTMYPGDAIVIVAAAAHHRKPAIQGIDYMMDRLKTDAPFWKKEISANGEIWILPRTEDYAARQEWDTHL